MKKILLAVLATALVAGGAASAPTAVAAEPYPGTVMTSTDAGGPRKMQAGKRPKSSVYVKTAGNGRAVGTIRVRYQHKASGTSRFKSVAYKGKRVTFFGPKLAKVGPWQIRAIFQPKSGSVWKTSRDSYSLKVIKKKKKKKR
ncbi:hypothetical protein [Nocardioides sp.]|uniref:hypothetical protein n=1 Tax=Nocardioides sp. TaxID=35761 RepID=UPI002735D818|nr:hypothetical protein [Nocardioides sp.]MDP3894674.1 hypothetical protein [Nocardioides sp.]